MIVLLSLIVVLIILVAANWPLESFDGGPNNKQIIEIVDVAMKNPEVFDPKNGEYMKARNIITGIDNVTYEDFRQLKSAGKFDRDNLTSALSRKLK